MKKNVGISYKAFAVILAAVLILGGAIGGTMAWLIDDTNAVANTFTYGDINIGLKESTGNDYKIVPGLNITKDPTVTVTAGSEDCWLFVKVEEKHWPEFTEEGTKTRKVDYSIAEDWTHLDGVPGVYYCQVESSDKDVSFGVLKGNQITVSENLEKSEVDKVKANEPNLTFTAYAVQLYKTNVNGNDNDKFTAAEAWAKVSGTSTTNN